MIAIGVGVLVGSMFMDSDEDTKNGARAIGVALIVIGWLF